MFKTKPNGVSLEALHTHTHTGGASGYLEYNKINKRHKYICVCFAYICKTNMNMPVSFCI